MLGLESIGLAEEVPHANRINTDLDPLAATLTYGPEWIETMRHSEIGGFSYRGFRVVSAAHFVTSEGLQYVMFGENVKLTSGVPKHCSEAFVLEEAKRMDAARVVALYIGGTTDPQKIDEVTFSDTATLHSCQKCRNDHFRSYFKQQILTTDTLIVSFGILQANEDPSQNHDDIVEAHFLDELWNRYGHPAHTDPLTWPQPSHDPNFENWRERYEVYGNLLAEPELLLATNRGKLRQQLARYIICGHGNPCSYSR